jgi:hypothetical protein
VLVLGTVLAGAAIAAACSHKMPKMPSMPSIRRAPGDTVWPDDMLDTIRRLAVVDSFSQPEAVRYDPDQDVYFVANFGAGDARADDNNGFIARVKPDGGIDRMRFIAGGENGATLHAPRGMVIVGDTIWVADNNAVRGFDRRNGAPTGTVDISPLGPGFLNDIAASPTGTLYVTDTPRNRIYRIVGRTATIAVEDTALGMPNGIAWDQWNARFIVVPYDGRHTLLAWSEGNPLTPFAESEGGKFDGIEVLGPNELLVSSQADTTLHLFLSGKGRAVIRTSGRPADLAVDTRRMRAAVPFIALNRIEIWQLPRK